MVYYYFTKWKSSGLFKKLHNILPADLRVKLGKLESASIGIIDSQSVKTTRKGGVRGIDGGKKVKGRKRHLIVDSLGLLIAVDVHAANIHDSVGCMEVIKKATKSSSRLSKIIADGGYRGKLKNTVKSKFRLKMDIVLSNDPSSFEVLPKRWIVERTFAWLESYRRLAKDYEYRIHSNETMIYLAKTCMMINRLEKF
ncbi:MAG TPA: IS5 family transposase [Luteibaculaceae bacterium]|nr:IS5 family transposase [Luteibaculaceae bacterium]